METTLATADSCLSLCIPAFRPTPSVPMVKPLIPFFFACQLPSPRFSPLHFQHLLDENLSFLSAEGFVNSSLSCLGDSGIHRMPESLGLEETSRSRSPTCDQSQLVKLARTLSASSNAVVYFQNIVSPPRNNVLFVYFSCVSNLLVQSTETQGAAAY